ncbi:MAG: ribosome recycling factor [Clostridiales Family XIII bacterium]|jgi:ribosome recycling factor|nr:ribosome recycling factor [Clostridiales Family XIII bacterium]
MAEDTVVQEKLEEKMGKTVSILKENLNTVRAGRANPALLDKVQVEYYGSPTPLKSVANISVPDPRSLLISPFDPKSLHDIEKAIGAANIGINPSNDGKVIRLQIPSLTEERRKELTKLVRKYGEDAKVAVRNERRDANEALKKMEKAGELTEDDLKDEEKGVQKRTDECIKEIDRIVETKEKEILEV